MKQPTSVFISIIIIAWSTLLMGQDIIELPKPKISNTYLNILKKVAEIKSQNRGEAVSLLKKALVKEKGRYERFGIIFSELSFLYAEGGEYQECLKVLKEGHDEGLFFPLMKTPRTWPEYYDSLAAQSGFSAFIEKNDLLKEEALKSSKLEYLVQLPAGYKAGKQYPLLMVLHGGIGSHIGLTIDWHSPRLDSEYVVVCVQGSSARGSFVHSYQQSDIANIAVAYHQVAKKYGIDTSRVILGGVSAGGAIAIAQVLRGQISPAGLLLVVPVKPQSLDEQQMKLDDAAKIGMRAAFLCGENDEMIKVQKEISLIFDKHNIPNRFIVASGIGHEYPKDFPMEIDRSLEFISKRE